MERVASRGRARQQEGAQGVELGAAHHLRGVAAADITGVGRSEAATAPAIFNRARSKGDRGGRE